MTQGALLVRAWLKADRRTQAWLAEQIGTIQPTLSKWLTGKHAPPIEFAIALHRVTGAPLTSWAEPVKRGRTRKAA